MRTQRCIYLLSDGLQIIIGLCMHVCRVPWPIALRFVVPFSSVTFCVLFNFKTKCLKNYGSFLVCVQNVKEKFVTFIFHFFKTSQQISPNKCFFFLLFLKCCCCMAWTEKYDFGWDFTVYVISNYFKTE